MRVELSEFAAAGAVSFGLESENLESVEINADIIPTDLTNLATAINNQSNRTGVTAHLSSNKERLILESKSGKDIFLSDLTTGTPAFKANVVNEDGSAASSIVTLGGGATGASAADQGRFSGIVKMVSSSAFTFADEEETLTRSAEDSIEGSFVSVVSNASADSKLVQFDVQKDADNNEASNDGRRAIAAGAEYNLTVLTSDEDIQFSASLSSAEVSPLNDAAVHKAMAKAVRSTAMLASLTAGTPAAKPQSVEYSFSGPNAIDQTNDSLTINVAGSNVIVNMGDADGMGTPVTTAELLTQAAARAINQANLGVVAAASSTTTNGATTYKFTISADAVGESFAMGAVTFVDADSLATLGLSDSIVASNLPEDGDAVFVDFAGDSYKIAMVDKEIVVSGGEEGRVTAYFDADHNLQIFAGGTLSGQAITLTGNNKVANNQAAAARFGLTTTQMRFSGQDIAPTTGIEPLTFSYNGEDIKVRLDTSGNIRTEPTMLPADMSVTFSETTLGRGRVIITYNSVAGAIAFDTPQDTMGVKVTDTDIHITEQGIKVSSVSGDVQNISVSATSLVEEKVEINELVVEDLLVFVTGSGAKMVSSLYDIPPLTGGEQQDLLLGSSGIALKAISEDGLHVEIIDKETGHSMATRVLDNENSVTFNQYQFTLKGQASLDDEFNVVMSESGSGDNRNLLKIIAQQSEDMNGQFSGGFSTIFSNIVAEVGASVGASGEALSGAEATKEAAIEAESEFSGVNLDSEAAALIEFQQAYQASARILSTARELFQTLIDVV